MLSRFLIFVFLFCPVFVYAQGQLIIDTDKANKETTIEYDGVVRLVFDYAAKTVLSYDKHGQYEGSLDLDDVIWDVSGGNPYAFSKRKNNILAVPTLSGFVGVKQSLEVYDPYPCFLSPCPQGYIPGSNPWNTYLNFDHELYTSTGPLDDGIPAALAEYDYNKWQGWRQEECDRANSAATWLQVTGSGGAAVVSCFIAAETLGTASFLCAASVAVYLGVLAERSEALNNCNAEYPGLGEW